MEMTTRTVIEAMRDVLPQVLEGTAFLFAEESPDPLGFAEGALGVAIRYEGIGSGEIRLWADPGFVPVFAANMLGLDEDDPAAGERGADALGELLNIAIGHCLTEAWGEEQAGRIGLPQRLPAEELGGDLEEDGFWFSAEGRALWLTARPGA